MIQAPRTITRPGESRIDVIIRQTRPSDASNESHLVRLGNACARAQDASEYDCRRAHQLFILALTGWTLFGLSLLALAFVCGGGLQ